MGTRRNKKLQPYPGPSQCHPRVGSKTPSGGCLPTEILEKAGKQLGVPSLTGGASRGQTRKKNSAYKTKLLNRLAEHLGVPTQNQRSFLQKLPLGEEEKQALASKWLRPPQPPAWSGDPDMWLDSNNIRDVMKQYEEVYPDFKFLGPYPIDFASPDPYSSNKKQCYIGEMCNLNLKQEIQNGKEHIGIVYNLDPHYKNGSHWVANYINIPKKQCYYFDSYGMQPPKQVKKFMQWLTLQDPKIELGWNGRRFQHKDSECGMYCLYFLDRMLSGEPYLKFVRRQPSDTFMLDLRDWFYST
jgi:hypothetical protein